MVWINAWENHTNECSSGKNKAKNSLIILEKARESADDFDCIKWIATRMEREVGSTLFW